MLPYLAEWARSFRFLLLRNAHVLSMRQYTLQTQEYSWHIYSRFKNHYLPKVFLMCPNWHRLVQIMNLFAFCLLGPFFSVVLETFPY